MPMDPIVAARFRGPPDSGNGGYSAGIAASYLDGPARVTLRAPVPLDTRMDVQHEGDRILFTSHGRLIMEAERGSPDGDVPTPPSFDEVAALPLAPMTGDDHVNPGCFVCGPAHETGLRLFPRQVDGIGTVAVPWEPEPGLRYHDGLVGRPYLYGALDCPSAWSAGAGVDVGPTAMLLGRMTARIERNVEVGEQLVISAWPIGSEGRKRYAGTAVHAGDELIAFAQTTWITL